MVRLVKGAYWDSEIKRAQVDGLADYPVLHAQGAYRRPTSPARANCWPRPKPSTPIRRTTPDAGGHHHMAGHITPASMSSSACTAWASRCTSRWWAPSPAEAGRPCRIYAPVGTHTKPCWPIWCAACWKRRQHAFVNRIADPPWRSKT